jgi:hypothetical protein
MLYDVDLRIKEVATGIRTEATIRLEVKQSESGLYIASNSMVSPMIAAGASPRYAILEYLGNLFYSTTVEAEMAINTDESSDSRKQR